MSGPGIAYSAALLLAVVFTGAGVAKLRRRASTARAFAALGLASPEVLAVGVPVSELALAVGLVLAPAEAGIVALAVLAGFTTFLVLAMRRGEALGCGCFGAARPAPIGRAEIVRNAVLAVAAGGAAFARRPVRPGVGDVVVVLGAAVVGRMLVSVVGRRLPGPPPASGPPVGSLAPALEGLRYQDHRRTLVAFVAPTCDGCAELRSALQPRRHQADMRVEVVDLDDVTAVAFAAFGVHSTPFLVVVDREGRVEARGRARTEAEVAALDPG